MTNQLFVYGTLMRGEASAHLVSTARTVEDASVRGRLYAVPQGYPALVTEGDDLVYGELLTFSDSGRTFH